MAATVMVGMVMVMVRCLCSLSYSLAKSIIDMLDMFETCSLSEPCHAKDNNLPPAPMFLPRTCTNSFVLCG